MTPEDLAQVHKAAFTQSRPWSAQEFTDLLSNPFVYVFGDNRCFALVQILAGEAELLTIATHSGHQRQGLAAACMTHWHSQAVTLGASRAILDVAADNTAAIALYRHCGYAPCGLRRGYYRRVAEHGSEINVDAIVMERALS